MFMAVAACAKKRAAGCVPAALLFSVGALNDLDEGTRKQATGFAIAKVKPKIKIGFKRSGVGKDRSHGLFGSFTCL